MLTFDQLQAEISEWQAKNFPNSTPNEPFHGIVEEIGELAGAILWRNELVEAFADPAPAKESIADAIADCTVFAVDFCNRSGFTVRAALRCAGIPAVYPSDLQNLAIMSRDYADSSMLALVACVGRLAHARLKMSQGIRGSETEHRETILNSIGELFVCLALRASRNGFNYEEIVSETWSKVKLRDWTVNRETGEAEVRQAIPAIPAMRSTNAYETN